MWLPSERDNLKAKAVASTAREIKCGRLLPAKCRSCVDCGKQAQQYDHRDYRKPLEVEPVCRSCNIRRGPGLPEIIKSDEQRSKLTHLASTAGCRWSGIEGGEGYSPLEFRLLLNVDWSRLEQHRDDILEVDRATRMMKSHEFFRKLGGLSIRRSTGRGFLQPEGVSRYEFFKDHDPWRLT